MTLTFWHISKIWSKMINGPFSHSLFEEENVSTAVAHNEMNRFYVISNYKVNYASTSWATALDMGKCNVCYVTINLVNV